MPGATAFPLADPDFLYQFFHLGRMQLTKSRLGPNGAPRLCDAPSSTVTLCHSKTRDLPSVCREADLLVVAIGRPGFITRDFVKEGAVVVDVGMNRLEALERAPAALRESARIRKAIADKGRPRRRCGFR